MSYLHCKFSWILIYLNFIAGAIMAQASFSRFDSISVSISGDTLHNPFAGGLNFPQFSPIDADNDGISDVFVFERSGNKAFVFLTKTIADTVQLIHALQYDTLFPDLADWALLVDFNKDGANDIFSSTPEGGIIVYINEISLNSELSFSLFDSLLTDTNNDFLYVSPWDIPAITDVDSDGDIDVLAFNIGGSSVNYYKNLSMEKYNIPDSLLFVLEDACWGKFQEAFNNCDIYLNTSCKTANFFSHQKNQQHAGSTLLAIDLDNDRDKELLVGDLICNTITELTNGGDSSNAYISASNTQFPSAYPVNIDQFPASFLIDVNNDSLDDLVVAPNATNISENYRGIWLYKNIGTNEFPDYSFQSKAFLQNEMIDVGEGASIAFFDVNADSLEDIIIGNYGYHQSSTDYISGLSYYENMGTATSPHFKLIDTNYADVSSLQLLGIYPCFGDIDGDEDEDMLIGEDDGNLHLFVNVGGKDKEANFIFSTAYYQAIDVGQYSTPQLIDVNRDGLLDLLIGERNGNINYYQNTGTVSNAVFSLVTDSFGGVNVCKQDAVSGYSAPCLVELDAIGEYTLLVGTESGSIYSYATIDNNLEGIFDLADSCFMQIWEGIRSTIALADLNNDDALDLGVSNYRGGIALFKNSAISDTTNEQVDTAFAISIYPNPAAEYFKIKIEGDINSYSDLKIAINNVLGQVIYQDLIPVNDMNTVNVSNAANGIYEVKLQLGEYTSTQKLLIIRSN